MKERIAIFPGSFNPFTIGHLSILRRGLRMFDRVVVVVGRNVDKPTCEGADLQTLAEKLSKEGNVEVIQWSGLTVDAARQVGADWILRGVRSVADYEYELQMADINRRIAGIDTVLLTAEPELSSISSSMVRELNAFGYNTDEYVI